MTEVHELEAIRDRAKKLGTQYRSQSDVDRVVLLEYLDSNLLKLHTCRYDTIQECWNLVSSHVREKPLPVGPDDTMQNGMVLASNILYELGVAVSEKPK